MTRLWRGVAILAIAFAVAACGGDDDDDAATSEAAGHVGRGHDCRRRDHRGRRDERGGEPAETTAAETSAAEEATSAPAEDAEPVTLTLWDRDILKEDWAKQIIEEYQAANPHVTIEYVLQPSDIARPTRRSRPPASPRTARTSPRSTRAAWSTASPTSWSP